MKLLLALVLTLSLAGTARAQGQLDLLQPATAGEQAGEQSNPPQSQQQQQLQQTPDQGQVLEILGGDIDDDAGEAEFDWSLWGPWLAVVLTLVLGAAGWLLERRSQLKA